MDYNFVLFRPCTTIEISLGIMHNFSFLFFQIPIFRQIPLLAQVQRMKLVSGQTLLLRFSISSILSIINYQFRQFCQVLRFGTIFSFTMLFNFQVSVKSIQSCPFSSFRPFLLQLFCLFSVKCAIYKLQCAFQAFQ